MVVVGWANEYGVVCERETRTLATVSGWPKCGRVRLSIRDAGGHYAAPWIGMYPYIRNA